MDLNVRLDRSVNQVGADFHSYYLNTDGSVTQKTFLNRLIRWVQDWWSDKTISDSMHVFRQSLNHFQALKSNRLYQLSRKPEDEWNQQVKRLIFVQQFILSQKHLFLKAKPFDWNPANLLNHIENKPIPPYPLNQEGILKRIEECSFTQLRVLSLLDVLRQEDTTIPPLSDSLLGKIAPDLTIDLPLEPLNKAELLSQYNTVFKYKPSSWLKKFFSRKTLEDGYYHQLNFVCETIVKRDPTRLGLTKENKDQIYDILSRRLQQISTLLNRSDIDSQNKKNALITLYTETADLCIPKWQSLFETVVRKLLNQSLDSPEAIFLQEKTHFVEQLMSQNCRDNPHSQHSWNALRVFYHKRIGIPPLDPKFDPYVTAYKLSEEAVKGFITSIKTQWVSSQEAILNSLQLTINNAPFNIKIRNLLIENLAKQGLANADDYVDSTYYTDTWEKRHLTRSGAVRLIRTFAY